MSFFDDIGGAISDAASAVDGVVTDVVNGASSIANNTFVQMGLNVAGGAFGDPTLGTQIAGGLSTAKSVLGGVNSIFGGGKSTPGIRGSLAAPLSPAQKSANLQAALTRAGFRTSTLTGKNGTRYSIVSYRGRITKVKNLGYGGTAPTFGSARPVAPVFDGGYKPPADSQTTSMAQQTIDAASAATANISSVAAAKAAVVTDSNAVAAATNETQLYEAQAALTQALSKANSGGGSGLAVVASRQTREF
jgi:hypothetical protein